MYLAIIDSMLLSPSILFLVLQIVVFDFGICLLFFHGKNLIVAHLLTAPPTSDLYQGTNLFPMSAVVHHGISDYLRCWEQISQHPVQVRQNGYLVLKEI